MSNAAFFDGDNGASCAPRAGSPYQQCAGVAVGRDAAADVDVGVDVATSTNCVVNVLCSVMFIWMGCACVCVRVLHI